MSRHMIRERDVAEVYAQVHAEEHGWSEGNPRRTAT